MSIASKAAGDLRRWDVLPADESRAAALAGELGIPMLVAQVLVARGICDACAASHLMDTSIEANWRDPLEIPGLSQVADVVSAAIDEGKRIAVFGDFDTDGVTATCTLVKALRVFGAEALPFLPLREGEGYGLTIPALERLLKLKPDLVVTVDNGIAAKVEAEWLLSKGVELAVTDHHEPSDLVPQGIAVCNPKLEASGPSHELAGAGVALKLVCELGRRRGLPDLWLEYTDLACLGTVADQMLFTAENRAIVAHGLRRINENPRPGIAAIASVAEAKLGNITSEGLAYTFTPRINAAGRVSDAAIALEVLIEDDPAAAMDAALRLEETNSLRKDIDKELTAEALAAAEVSYHGERALVLGGEGWNDGVKGIVAAKLANAYKVPVILFSIEDGVARGSGRSVGSVNLFKAVTSCSSILDRYGGHDAAVGILLPASKLGDFRKMLVEYMDGLPQDDFVSVASVDVSVSLEELTYESFAALEKLAPFGQGMPVPNFVAEGVFINSARAVGANLNHLSFSASNGISRVPAIMFNCPDIEDVLECDQAVDILFQGKAEEWRGHFMPKMHVKDIKPHVFAETLAEHGADGCEYAESDFANPAVERIMRFADDYLESGPYAGIQHAASFNTKVAGVTYEGRQQLLEGLNVGDALRLVRDSDNEYDPNAIAVFAGFGQVGFLNCRLAEKLAPAMDDGAHYEATVTEVTGSDSPDKNLGLNILVERAGGAGVAPEAQEAETELAERRRAWQGIPADQLTERLKMAIIGDNPMHDAQARALENLNVGVSTLAVMATGRGKSLIFHLHAARVALRGEGASVFVYPLRALVADQYLHISSLFDDLGLSARILTGETPELERREVYEGLASGAVNVVLTTPEYLVIHAPEFASATRIAFLAIDEAHHIGLALSGHRSAYRNLDDVRAKLGNPVCLAVTATCRDQDAEAIDETLGTTAHVLDPAIRANLEIDDKRKSLDDKSKDFFIATMAESGEKMVVYVNSRKETVRLARMVRKRLPGKAAKVAYYHGGLPKLERACIEEAFREGDVTVLFATSAFGEGVNIPDIRHVVLFHLPFNEVDFNQMSGRAGRDDAKATIHLLFSREDAWLNERILRLSSPGTTELTPIYRVIRKLAGNGEIASAATYEDACSLSDLDPWPQAVSRKKIAQESAKGYKGADVTEATVSAALAVFEELKLLHLTGRGASRRIVFVNNPIKTDVHCSIRYQEGASDMLSYREFVEWITGANASDILARINRPILPTR